METLRDDKPDDEATSLPPHFNKEFRRKDQAADTDEDKDSRTETNEPADQQEEEEYDPSLNPNWRTAFRNRETIFDNRLRFQHPSKTFDENRKIYDAWCQERSVISQVHKCLKREADSLEYSGAGWVRKLRTTAEQQQDMWYRRFREKVEGEPACEREREEGRAQETVIRAAKLQPITTKATAWARGPISGGPLRSYLLRR